MDRLNQIRGEAGSSRDSTLDTSSPPSEAYMSANESSSKYFSLSEVDSTFGISPSKDSVPTADAERSIRADSSLMTEVSPIPKSDLESYKIGKQIEAANILSGGVNIFDDNDNSYDGDELVIDDNIVEEKSPTDLKLDDSTVLPEDKNEENLIESLEDDIIPSKDTEVVLQIDGNNVHAIDIGNGLYLYRKAGEEELAAVQMIDDDQQQPSFKFLKVRENAEGNLEVYEEIEVEVTKEVPIKQVEIPAEKSSHVPIKDISKVISEPLCNKAVDKAIKTPKNELSFTNDENIECNLDVSECKTEVNFNGKIMKFNESRKSPVIGTFTPMTYHSTPNKERIPLTKTMVDQQLHPSRHSDNVKKTIEVHTDSPKQKLSETPTKSKKTFNEIEISSKDEDKKETNSSVKNLNDQFNCATDTLLDKNGPVEFETDFMEEERKATDKDSEDATFKNIDATVINIDDTVKNIDATVKNIDATVKNIVATDISEVISKEEEIFKNNTELKKCENEEYEKVMLLKPENDVAENNKKLCTANNNQLKCTETDEDFNELEAKFMENDSEESNLIIDDKESNLTSEQDNTTKEDVVEVKLITEKDSINSDTYREASEAQELQKSSSASSAIIATKEKKPLESVDDLHKSVLSESIENNDTANSHEIITESNNLDGVGKDSDDIIDISEDSNELVILSKCGDGVENNKIYEELHAENKSKLNINKIINITKSSKLYENDVKECVKDNTNEEKIENTTKLNPNNENESADIIVDKIIKSKSEDIVCDKDYTSIYESDCNIKSSTNKEIVIIEDIQETNSTKFKSLISDEIPAQEQPISIEMIASENDVKDETNNIVCIKKDVLKTSHEIGSHKSSDIKINIKEKHMFTNRQDSLKCSGNNIKNDAYKVEIITKPTISKVINNNSAVPFGKWTEANRQEFLNKIKETKIPSNNSNTKQLKQPNDLNRRDVLKKIDSQRQSNVTSLKACDSGLLPKINPKTETSVFVSKMSMVQQSVSIDTTVTTLNAQNVLVTPKPAVSIITKQQEPTNSNSSTNKNIQRKELNNQDLIDITIEGIINRAIIGKSSENINEKQTDVEIQNTKHCPVSLDDIEMKMNDIHGISCNIEPTQQPSHAKPLAKPKKVKTNISEKVPNLLPFKKKVQKNVRKDNVLEDTSDDEIIEHVPITGDIDGNKQNKQNLALSTKNKSPETKKETIITENEFDKFARRNSITYENCLTVSFDGKESHNVIQTVVEKEPPVKKLSRNELMLAESKAKSSNKHSMPVRSNIQLSRIPTLNKGINEEDALNKNNQSKVQIAYQSALTAKRNLECPITIIEDKPVKVVFMDANTEFTPSQLNVQGQELSPSKTESVFFAHSTSESLDSDALESSKIQDETKVKTKHQRKQVLTPVEEPEIELIEPVDLGIIYSPKKKRKFEDKIDKHSKNVVPKKSYLLNRNVNDEKTSNKSNDSISNVINIKKDSEKRSDPFVSRTDAISAIDNLVKAAELIETQSENKSSEISLPTTETPQNTPVKRGRGRPRKYPLVEPENDTNKAASPQKKPRLIDAKVKKTEITDSDSSSDEGIIQENWTMGKINENIVCPICSKLFRSENVVFKHVKHCPGPSPNRSDSDKRSPIRLRHSQDSDKISSRSDDTDDEEEEKPRSRRSRYTASKFNSDNDIIVIEDTPLRVKPEKVDKSDSKTANIKTKHQLVKRKEEQTKTHNLICEFCGKTFRQLSYLVNHKIQQHKQENAKSLENDHEPSNKTVFSCEVCKKDFRKLHHLVQHRLIHNSNTNNIRITRKSSSDQHDIKPLKHREDTKPSTDPSAGFRCEPCDKSFRKLHHLVEHRETHDGINKKSSTAVTSSILNTTETVEIPPTHNCDVCKKVFKKLQDLLEHKELHFETGSEKSDDKSVKSSLSTKDIIHECSLCYMVFPNEHSLNKHTVLCLRKKKQSAAKAAKQAMEKEAMALDAENIKVIENDVSEVESPNNQHQVEGDETSEITAQENSLKAEQQNEIKETNQPLPETKVEEQMSIKKHHLNPDLTEYGIKTEKKMVLDKQDDTMKKSSENFEIPEKIKNKDIQECIIIPDTPTPKKKIHVKDKVTSANIKKIKTVSYTTSPVVKESKPKESSDEDDDIRYMLNPNFKKKETSESKLFMKVRAKKRNSLQIERPNSKDLVKRRISLQHPPKIPRLKAKAIETKPIVESKNEKMVKLDVKDTILSTDSDDSDVKYSFPDPVSTDDSKDKKSKRQSVAAKRKSISGIAKRKILGKHKPATPKTRKRTSEAEHRCDCGQLFSSAALLSRHTSLAHTPPRIRRRRDPPPERTQHAREKDRPKPVKRKSDVTDSHTASAGVGTRKSSVNYSDAKGSSDASKKCQFGGKSLRSSTIRGAPVPEKMRKLAEKTKK